MKRQDLNNKKEKGIAELNDEVLVMTQRIRSLRTDLSLGKVKSLKEIKNLRVSIAQLKTLIREKSGK